jgi:hypothetical protein
MLSCLILYHFSVKKRREQDSDTISRSEKYRSERTIAELDKQNKGSETTKSFYLKKRLWEDVSSANTDKVHLFLMRELFFMNAYLLS